MKKIALTAFVMFGTLVSAEETQTLSQDEIALLELAQASKSHGSSSAEIYQAKDFSNLLSMPGFSDKALNTHFKLYQGYVKNTNLLLSILEQLTRESKDKTPQYAEIKRRLGWEFDGMRLHELYFANLGGQRTKLATNDPLFQRISQDFGSFDAWKQDFIATGSMRGIGWAVLYFDPYQKRLINTWVGEHDIGHLATANPVLIMDVWEHAYMIDYGLERMDYINAFFNNINWDVVSKRFTPQQNPDGQKLSEKESRKP